MLTAPAAFNIVATHRRPPLWRLNLLGFFVAVLIVFVHSFIFVYTGNTFNLTFSAESEQATIVIPSVKENNSTRSKKERYVDDDSSNSTTSNSSSTLHHAVLIASINDTTDSIIVTWNETRIATARKIEAEIDCVFGDQGRWIRHRNRPLPDTAREEVIMNRKSSCIKMWTDFTEDNYPGLWYGWTPPAQQCTTGGIRSITNCSDPQSDSCALNAPQVCQALHGRDLLLVGDSTLTALHDSFLLQMRAGLSFPKIHYHIGRCCPSYVMCEGTKPLLIRTARNDLLGLTDDEFLLARQKGHIAFGLTEHWRNHSVIVLNRGIHFEPTALVIPAIRKMLRFLHFHVPKAVIIYHHTNLPVHKDLFKKTPQDTPAPIKISKSTYGWEHIQQQNDDVRAFLVREFPEVININITSMISMRVDNRMDPVHSCNPGFVDWQAVVLAHVIVMLNTSITEEW